VRVAVNFLPEQSRIEAGKWFWVYHVRIENDGNRILQLLTRHWRITDGHGAVNLVEGEGVVGETPVLAPGPGFQVPLIAMPHQLWRAAPIKTQPARSYPRRIVTTGSLLRREGCCR
jgi:hypothetical protein